MPIADYHDQFASIYDTLYQERDVGAEVTMAARLLNIDAKQGSRVLDFGCGTGSHVLAFASQGISAMGFDASTAMIAQARRKCLPRESAEVHFTTGALSGWLGADVSADHGSTGRFDAAVSFFNVLNCMESPEEMLDHLRGIHDVLDTGAMFLADVWNGAAVFVDEPRPNVRHFAVDGDPSSEVIRITVPTVDRVNQRCTLQYHVLVLNKSSGRYTEFESVHRLRFLTPVQYRHLFELAGLTIIDEFPKGNPQTKITDDDWYITYLVRRDD